MEQKSEHFHDNWDRKMMGLKIMPLNGPWGEIGLSRFGCMCTERWRMDVWTWINKWRIRVRAEYEKDVNHETDAHASKDFLPCAWPVNLFLCCALFHPLNSHPYESMSQCAFLNKPKDYQWEISESSQVFYMHSPSTGEMTGKGA